MSAFDNLEFIQPQLLADGYLARAVHGERLTLAVVEIKPGAELPEHQIPQAAVMPAFPAGPQSRRRPP